MAGSRHQSGHQDGLVDAVLSLDARLDSLGERVGVIESRMGAFGIPGLETAVAEPVAAESPLIADLVATATTLSTTETSEPEVETESVEQAEAPPARVYEEEPVSIPPVPAQPEITWSAPPAFGPAPIADRVTSPARAKRDLEQLVSGRGMAFAGGLAILLGAVFFLSLAFSRGWIGPDARVVIGVGAAAAMMALGARFFGRKEALFGHVMTAVGLGVMSLSMMAATRLYDLISVELGLAVSLLAAAAAAAIAIRANVQVVAAYGLVAVLAAPPILGAEANGVTIALLASALAGTTAIALYRTWNWLPTIAFILSAPQLADWILGDPSRGGALAALGGLWLLHAVAAGGEAFRDHGTRLRPTSAALLVGDAAYLIWGGFEILDGDATGWRGTFLLAVAVAHVALGSWFLRDRGDRNPFGMLAFGTGLAALTMAVPVQFGGPVVPLAWAAEGAALAWAASRLRNLYGASVSVLMGLMAIAHVAIFEYPIIELTRANDSDLAFLNANGMTLAFVLFAMAMAGLFSRLASVRQALAAVGLGLVTFAMPYEVSGVGLVIGWSILTMLAIVFSAWRTLRSGPTFAAIPGQALLRLATIVPWAAAAIHLAGYEYPMNRLDAGLDRGTPFLHLEGLALLFVVAAAAHASAIGPRPVDRVAGVLAGFAAVIYAVPFELSGTALVGGWSLVAAIAIGLTRLRMQDRLAAAAGPESSLAGAMMRSGLRFPAFAATILAAGHLFTYEYPLGRIAEDWAGHPPFLNANGLALLFVVAAVGFLAVYGSRINRVHMAPIGFALLAYAMPFELSGVALIAGWAVMAVIAIGAEWWMTVPEGGRSEDVPNVGATLRQWGPALAAIVPWTLGAMHLLAVEFVDGKTGTPFTDDATFGAVILVAASLTGSLISRVAYLRTGARVASLAIAAALMPLELGEAATVVAWSAIAIVSLLLMEGDAFGRRLYLGSAAILVIVGVLRAMVDVAPPNRLFVDDQARVDHPLLWSGATAAFASLAIVFAYARWRYSAYTKAHRLALAAGALLVYLLSIGVVDHFQGQLAEVGLDALQKRAQVGLSILWAVLGGVAFAAGVIRRHREVRLAALALLGLATGKVFIYDMASLDASYRVLSLIGLGALLLVSSYLYQRLAAPTEQENVSADDRPGHGADLAAGA